jgi:hypothetical protein
MVLCPEHIPFCENVTHIGWGCPAYALSSAHVHAAAPPHIVPSRWEVGEHGNWLTVSWCRKCWRYVCCSLHVPAMWLQLAQLCWMSRQLEENI